MLRHSEFGAKLPSFGVMKNSEVMVTTKLVKNWHSFKFSYNLGEPTLEICKFSQLDTLILIGFLGGQVKWVTLYVRRAAIYDLAMFFSSSSFSLAYISVSSIVSHYPDTFPLQACRPVWLNACQKGEYWAVKIRLNKFKQLTTV